MLNKVAFVHFHKGEKKVSREWDEITERYRDVVMTCTFDTDDADALEFA
jgi:hypothetical protein